VVGVMIEQHDSCMRALLSHSLCHILRKIHNNKTISAWVAQFDFTVHKHSISTTGHSMSPLLVHCLCVQYCKLYNKNFTVCESTVNCYHYIYGKIIF